MHPLDQPSRFVDTIYVLDRMIMDDCGAVVDSQFMGVLTSRDHVTNRISAAHHFGGIQNGIYRVMELIPDAPVVTHIYQVKAFGAKQEWMRLAKNKSPGSDSVRFRQAELYMFTSDDEYLKALQELRRRQANLRRTLTMYTLAMIISAAVVLLLRLL